MKSQIPFKVLCFCDDLIGLELPSDATTVITSSGARTEKHRLQLPFRPEIRGHTLSSQVYCVASYPGHTPPRGLGTRLVYCGIHVHAYKALVGWLYSKDRLLGID